MSSIDSLIVEADLAAASIRAGSGGRLPWGEIVEWTSRRQDLSMPRRRRRRHRALPLEYRISKSELIIMGTALAVLIGALTFPLAWILFRIAS